MLNNAVEEGFVNRSRREDSIRAELTQIETGRLSSRTDLAVLSPILDNLSASCLTNVSA
jgi:hypothetical protein